MKKIIILSTVIFSLLLKAQVGIGTVTPDASSALEMVSTEKGVLIPRVNTAAMNAITNPSAGLWVYNEDVKNFMGYNGTLWTQDTFFPSVNWDLKGNTPATYVGTSNSQAFIIKTSNNQVLGITTAQQIRIVPTSSPNSSELFVAPSQAGTSFPTIYLTSSNGFGTTPFAVTALSSNGGGGSVLGNYAFSNTLSDAEAGVSSAGFSYINDIGVSGLSFYTGGHPSDIDDRSKEAMIITSNNNLGVGVHTPGSRVSIGGGDLYITDPNRGLIISTPNNNCRRITVDDSGALVISSVITCP